MEIASVPDNFAASQRQPGPRLQLHALVWGVVDGVMQPRVRQLEITLVPHHQVGVRAGSDSALAGVQTVGLGRVGGRQLDKLRQGDATSEHSLRIQQRQTSLEPRNTVWYMPEGHLLTARLLALGVVETKWRMVG
ncbi:hypothetical protein D9M69_654620 [compost metagenome]